MAESNGDETSSSDDREFEESSRGFDLGYISGNDDNSEDSNADSLDELSARSEHTTSDQAEQDNDTKSENTVDYEGSDEEYDGPEVQEVTEEDHLLPKREYFSAAGSLGSLYSRASVFDDEDYDEGEEQEEEHLPVEKAFDSEEREPAVVFKEYKAWEYKKASILGNEDQIMGTEDIQEEEVDELLKGTLDEKSAMPLPTLCVEDGLVILQFSEIFAVHKPPQKRDKKENRYITNRDRYKYMDLIEDDEEVLLKSYGRTDTHVKQGDLIQMDVPLPVREDLPLVKVGTVTGVAPESREFTKLGRDSFIMGEPLKQDLEDDLSSTCQSQLSMEILPLDQQEWEDRILWETSPGVSSSGEGFESGLESEGVPVHGNNSETEQESFNAVNSREQAQANNNMLLPFFVNPLESFGSRASQSTNESTNKTRRHPQLLRLESQWDEDHLSENDAGGENLKRIGRFSRLASQEKDMGVEAWLDDSIIWESDKVPSRSKLIYDLQDEQMIFEILDKEERKYLQLHAGAKIVSPSSESNNESFQEACGSNSGWQFNISNDKFYMSEKNSHQLQANANKSVVHSLKVLHSAPAVKLETMKNKLRNKEIANFHRPRALWYPHDNELAIKQQGKLPTQGSMNIVVKSLGGKGSKLHVGIEESVSSLKAKASRKLDFEETEAVKMFYMGKELEDEKSLAEQNVQPNSLVHLVRTKIHLWPWAQKLPGENKSLRPPGAFAKKSGLSTQDGHVFLMEYCEERPLMLSNAGMGASLCTYYQKSSPEDQHENLLRNQSDSLGNVMILEPGDKSPFLGEIQGGCSQSSVETNMYKAPVFPHSLQSTDYLLVRSPKGKLSLRRIDKILAVGQQEPRMEVMSPASKDLQTYLVNRMLLYVYQEFRKGCHQIAADELSFLFSKLSDAVLRRNMKSCAELKRNINGQRWWYKKPEFKIPRENELKNLVTPEDVCSYESMLAGLYRLKHLGITRFTLPASISAVSAQLPDEAIALATASHVERELQITPWNLSSNFVACTAQDRANIECLEITGVGDPSGRGLGFSYVRTAPKAPAATGHMKKKGSVSGTDADLRRLSSKAAQEVLLTFNVPDEIIAKQTRYQRIAMICKLSSEQAESGVKVDPTTIGKYARGKQMSILQLKQQAREKCQEIWDRQLVSLSAFDGDENESEDEANSDLESFAGDLENLLGFEEGKEESNTSKNDKLNAVKMRRQPSHVETDAEIEDEAAEYAELYRLLVQDEDHKKKKKMKAVGEGMGSFPLPWPSVDLFRKANVIGKKPDASFLVNESTIKDPANNVSVFKGKKTTRDNFVCGACGQRGHMKTNRHCPKYGKNTESHPQDKDMKKKSVGKSSSSDLSGQVKLKPIEKKKPVPTMVSIDEAPKRGNSTSKTEGIPAGEILDKPGSKISEVGAAVSTNSIYGISKLKISSKSELKEAKVESDSLMPQKQPCVGEPLSSRERKQDSSSRHAAILITQPSLSMDKDEAETRRPQLVIRLPTEPQKKLVIKGSKEIITDYDRSSLEENPRFESRKTKRNVDSQRQQIFRLSENSLDLEPKEDRIWREEQGRHRERRGYHNMTVPEESNEIGETRRRKGVMKKIKKLQPEIIEDNPHRRSRYQYLSDFERSEPEYIPQPKRHKKGQVGLANILEGIVDTLRAKELKVSYLFLKPVSKKEAPDYFDVVERPMDLSTIRDKVRKMEYRDREEFRHDVLQIKLNAHLYNGRRNPTIPPLADELLLKCDNLLVKYKDELTEAEKGI